MAGKKCKTKKYQSGGQTLDIWTANNPWLQGAFGIFQGLSPGQNFANIGDNTFGAQIMSNIGSNSPYGQLFGGDAFKDPGKWGGDVAKGFEKDVFEQDKKKYGVSSFEAAGLAWAKENGMSFSSDALKAYKKDIQGRAGKNFDKQKYLYDNKGTFQGIAANMSALNELNDLSALSAKKAYKTQMQDLSAYPITSGDRGFFAREGGSIRGLLRDKNSKNYQQGGFASPLQQVMGYKDNSPWRGLPYQNFSTDTLTMDGVSRHLLAVPNNGFPQLMTPNSGTYKFPGATSITEIPVKQDGGVNIYNKYTPGGSQLSPIQIPAENLFVQTPDEASKDSEIERLKEIIKQLLAERKKNDDEEEPADNSQEEQQEQGDEAESVHNSQEESIENELNGGKVKRYQNSGVVSANIRAIQDLVFGGKQPYTPFYLKGDTTYEYAKDSDGEWVTRRKGNDAWITLRDNKSAIKTLDSAFNSGNMSNNSEVIKQKEKSRPISEKIYGYEEEYGAPIYKDINGNEYTKAADKGSIILSRKKDIIPGKYNEYGTPIYRDIYGNTYDIASEIGRAIQEREMLSKMSPKERLLLALKKLNVAHDSMNAIYKKQGGPVLNFSGKYNPFRQSPVGYFEQCGIIAENVFQKPSRSFDGGGESFSGPMGPKSKDTPDYANKGLRSILDMPQNEFIPVESLLPIQTEKGEMIVHPTGDISKVMATKRHHQMNDDEVTDLAPQNSYILSAHGKVRIYKDEAKNVITEVGVKPYRLGDSQYKPTEKTLADFMRSSKETPAELAKRVEKAFPVLSTTNPFELYANNENKINRKPYLEGIIQLSELDKERKGLNDNSYMQQVQEQQVPVESMQKGGSPKGSPFPLAELLGAGLDAFDAWQQNKYAKEAYRDVLGIANNSAQQQKQNIGMGSLAGILGVANQDPTVNAVNLTPSYLQNFRVYTPNSVLDTISNQAFANMPQYMQYAPDFQSGLAAQQAAYAQALKSVGDARLQTSERDRAAYNQWLTSLQGYADANEKARVDAFNATRLNRNAIVGNIGDRTQGMFDSFATIEANRAQAAANARLGQAANQQQAIRAYTQAANQAITAGGYYLNNRNTSPLPSSPGNGTQTLNVVPSPIYNTTWGQQQNVGIPSNTNSTFPYWTQQTAPCPFGQVFDPTCLCCR